MRLALKIELAQRQRPAFDIAGIEPRQSLVIAFVGNPDAFEIAVIDFAVRVLQNGRQCLPRQAPPLAAHMRDQPSGNIAFEPDLALQFDVFVEQIAVLFP